MRHNPILSFARTNPTISMVIVLIVLATAFGLSKWLQGGAGGEQQGGMAVAVDAAMVEQGALKSTLTAVGSLLAQEGVILRPEIAGVVSEILFKDGDTVAKGQPLLRLDDSIYKAQLAQAQAELALAERTLNRAQALVGRGAGTEQSRDEAASRQRTAAAAVELAQANMAKSLISAPFAGTTGIRQVNVGDYVSPGQTLVSLQALDTLKLDFGVPETVLASLKVGQPVSLTVSAYPGEAFTGEVSAIDPLVDPNTRNVSLRALIPNPAGKLRPGLFAAVTLTLATADNTLFVPSAALYPMGDKQIVFAIKDGKAVMTPVTTGLREANRVAITSGLTVGDQVVTAGHAKVMMFGQGNPVDVTIANAPPATPAAPASPDKPTAGQ